MRTRYPNLLILEMTEDGVQASIYKHIFLLEEIRAPFTDAPTETSLHAAAVQILHAMDAAGWNPQDFSGVLINADFSHDQNSRQPLACVAKLAHVEEWKKEAPELLSLSQQAAVFAFYHLNTVCPLILCDVGAVADCIQQNRIEAASSLPSPKHRQQFLNRVSALQRFHTHALLAQVGSQMIGERRGWFLTTEDLSECIGYDG